MSNRRMFSKTVTESDEFLSLPHSAQMLYIHIGMNTDDEGYCERLRVMRLSLGCQKDVTLLTEGKFIYVFDNKVFYDLYFEENNTIRKDRKKESKYAKLYPPSTICQPDDNQMSAQVKLSKVNISKDRKEKNIKKEKTARREDVPYDKIIGNLNELAKTYFLANTEATMQHINHSWDYLDHHPEYKDNKLEAFYLVNRRKVEECLENPDQRKWLKPSVIYRMGKRNNNFENNLNQPEELKKDYGGW